MGKRVHPLAAFAANVLLNSFGIKRQSTEDGIPELGDIPEILALRKKDGAVVLILGRRESGKTILAQRLAEILERPTYAISPEQSTPHWIREIKLEQVSELPPPNSALILDDIPVYASQRDYTDTFIRALEQLIPVVRHRRKIILIFSSQSSGLSDKYIMDSDIILLKSANMLFSDLERPSVVKLYKQVMPIFDEMSLRQQQKHCFLFSQSWKGLVRVNLPHE